ncbi:MAG: hypothetical protein LBC21_00235, partial [Oscillospiraceae bacterium]|nr:hypothetical protein [Oscillospiraceae bacterium]
HAASVRPEPGSNSQLSILTALAANTFIKRLFFALFSSLARASTPRPARLPALPYSRALFPFLGAFASYIV